MTPLFALGTLNVIIADPTTDKDGPSMLSPSSIGGRSVSGLGGGKLSTSFASFGSGGQAKMSKNMSVRTLVSENTKGSVENEIVIFEALQKAKFFWRNQNQLQQEKKVKL